jgi:hypothetical protein
METAMIDFSGSHKLMVNTLALKKMCLLLSTVAEGYHKGKLIARNDA